MKNIFNTFVFILIISALFTVCGLFASGLSIAANITVLAGLIALCIFAFTSLWNSYVGSAKPYVPDYAITLKERITKSKSEGSMGLGLATGVIGTIIYIILWAAGLGGFLLSLIGLSLTLIAFLVSI